MRKKKPTGMETEGTLFPLEEIRREPQKKNKPYRAYNCHHKRGSYVSSLWMKLYPDPKRPERLQHTETGEATRKDEVQPK